MKNKAKHTWSRVLTVLLALQLSAGLPVTPAFAAEASAEEAAEDAAAAAEVSVEGAAEDAAVDEILEKLSLDEKLSQMIFPAIRSWNETDLTDLSAAPEIAEALRAHQYGGLVLYSSNIKELSQTVKLIRDLQMNNAENEKASVHIPYCMGVDEEGGIVLRLPFGTRMNGNMAIGATAEQAEENARRTGRVIGEELSAMGFNVDFAPVIDVNNDAANPVIGTRSFSDDPETVARLGTAWAEGLQENHIVATYKHFPGHGDTDTDSHIGTPTVEKTYEELKETELVPFAAAIQNGADMIMTAHITYPLVDEEVTFGDGVTRGFLPATMSGTIINEILRGDLGYDGVVIADALEMDAIAKAGLVEGEENSTEYRINIGEKVINAGVDVLLLPLDLNNEEAIAFYDDYIDGLSKKVEEGDINMEEIDDSVRRILKLKEKYGILDTVIGEDGLEEAVAQARKVLGSEEHHEVEWDIAASAITVVKNENGALPVSKDAGKIVILNRNEEDSVTANSAVQALKEEGLVREDADIYVDFYFDSASKENPLRYTDELREKIKEADVVIGFSKNFNLSGLASTSAQEQGIRKAMDDTHAAGGTFILISDNLPYDAARFQEADGILLAYMGSGIGVDPTERDAETENLKSINANVLMAMETAFGGNQPTGKLPVNVPVIEEHEDGTVSYGSELLYARGYGLSY